MDTLEIRFNYPQMNEVMKVIKKYPIQIVEQEVNNDCWYKLSYPHRIEEEVKQAFDKAVPSH
jgi:putative IMPACT (imprinted ancient) family translation regulator